MKKYLTYCTTEFERFNRGNHELIGVSYGYDIYDAKSDIQMYLLKLTWSVMTDF